MNLTAVCSSCQKTLSADAQHAGKKIRCPGCKGVVQLPKALLASARKAGSAADATRSEATAKAPAAKPPGKKRKPPEGDSEPRRRPVKKRARKKKARPARNDDDIWNAPLSSYSSPAIPEEEYEEYGVARPKRRTETSRSEGRGGQSADGGKGPLLICSIVCGITVLLAIVGALVGSSSPGAGQALCYPAIIVGGLLNLYGSLKILGNAFEEDAVVGLMYLFLPIYPLYFLATRWDVNATPFVISLIGTAALAIGLVAQISIAVA